MEGEKNMQNINLAKITQANRDGNITTFTIEPFYPGYGTTLGNALRRILLSSLPGAAVTAAKIKGVNHEFTSVPGVKEDAIELILNLKQVRLSMDGNEPMTFTIKMDKAGKVKAGDLKLPTGLKVTNPDRHIATIDSAKEGLEIELRVESGRGYSTIESRKDKELPVGMIAMDAIFSPVTSVNYQVEKTRVGDKINYDRLVLEVTTDGTIDAEEALKEAAQILIDQSAIFVTDQKEEKEKGTNEPDVKDVLKLGVDELNLSIRTTNALNNNKVVKVKDIKKLGLEGLKDLKGLGDKAFNEVVKKVKKLGLELE